jgi:branched-chain amino acid transport system substrate-binding protein
MRSAGPLLGVVAAVSLASIPSAAQDAYKIGVTGSLTGPAAGTYAPVVDTLRAFFDQVNREGGINGKHVQLVIQDDQGQPSNAAANTKRLLTQANVMLMINTSLSSTYAPVIAETQRAGVPLLFAGGVCPQEAYPRAAPLLFCTTAYAARYDSRATLDFVKSRAMGEVRLGLVAMAIPVSRGEIDFAEDLSKQMGMRPVAKEIVPPSMPDYTPIATKLKKAEPNWVYSWAPWVTQVKTLEALRKLGWDGHYVAWAHLEAEGELQRLKDPKFYVIGTNSLFSDKLPVHQEIANVARAANLSYPVTQLTEGWVAGLVVQAALQGSREPGADRIRAAMKMGNVDTKGLRGGPIVWTEDNHFRTEQHYRVYRWNPDRNATEVMMDWKTYAVK